MPEPGGMGTLTVKPSPTPRPISLSNPLCAEEDQGSETKETLIVKEQYVGKDHLDEY